jgi:hypothetical protein
MLGAKRSKPQLGAERMSLQIAENHPETLPFVEAVGKLIQNLGMIESQTYEWISALQTDPWFWKWRAAPTFVTESKS